jgi:SAM-dependent methyltransferase
MPEYIVEYGSAAASPGPDDRLEAGAFHRNHGPIGEVLSQHLSDRSGDVLELGSGTGQHAVALARLLPQVTWWPSDANEKHLRSIEAWRVQASLANLRSPVRLDLSQPDWRLAERGLPTSFLAMFCANVIHVAPWSVSEGLIAGAGRHLQTDGRLFLYGPFRREGVHNAPSNATFDAALRADNPEWGVRDTADLRALATAAKLELVEIVEMPSNNAVLLFERPAV